MADQEEFAVRFAGGPNPGTFILKGSWPLPRQLGHFEADGWYEKISESELPAQDAGSPLIRGAQYKWHPNWLRNGGSQGQDGPPGGPGHE